MKLPKLVHLDIDKHEEHKGFTCAVCDAKRMVKLPDLVQKDKHLDVGDRMFYHKDVHSHPDQKLFHKDLAPPTHQRFVIKEPDILKDRKRFSDDNADDPPRIKRDDYFAPRQPVLLIKNIKNPIFLRKERRRFQKESCLTQKPDTLLPDSQRGTGALHARLMSKIQINNQMSTLRSLQNLTPIQTYSNRMIRFKLMQNHRRQTMPFGLQQSPSTKMRVKQIIRICSRIREI